MLVYTWYLIFTLNGNSEIDAHVKCKIDLICLRHLFRSTALAILKLLLLINIIIFNYFQLF